MTQGHPRKVLLVDWDGVINRRASALIKAQIYSQQVTEDKEDSYQLTPEEQEEFKRLKDTPVISDAKSLKHIFLMMNKYGIATVLASQGLIEKKLEEGKADAMASVEKKQADALRYQLIGGLASNGLADVFDIKKSSAVMKDLKDKYPSGQDKVAMGEGARTVFEIKDAKDIWLVDDNSSIYEKPMRDAGFSFFDLNTDVDDAKYESEFQKWFVLMGQLGVPGAEVDFIRNLRDIQLELEKKSIDINKINLFVSHYQGKYEQAKAKPADSIDQDFMETYENAIQHQSKSIKDCLERTPINFGEVDVLLDRYQSSPVSDSDEYRLLKQIAEQPRLQNRYSWPVYGVSALGAGAAGYYGAVVGATIGASLGAGFFGVGAIPGAIIGAFLGALINSAIVVGLGFSLGGFLSDIGLKRDQERASEQVDSWKLDLPNKVKVKHIQALLSEAGIEVNANREGRIVEEDYGDEVVEEDEAVEVVTIEKVKEFLDQIIRLGEDLEDLALTPLDEDFPIADQLARKLFADAMGELGNPNLNEKGVKEQVQKKVLEKLYPKRAKEDSVSPDDHQSRLRSRGRSSSS